jgi:hypothetical protein
LSAERHTQAIRLRLRSAAAIALGTTALLMGAGCSSNSSESGDSGTTSRSQPSGSAVGATGTDAQTRDTGGKVFSIGPTRRCLNEAGLHAYLNPQNTVVMGSGGELRVVLGGYGTDWIYIAFGRDASEAQKIQERAVTATRKQYPQVDPQTVLDSVRVRGNVFYYADGGPVTIAESRKIDACLR